MERYGVWFISPRGFANEGVFAFGSEQEWQELFQVLPEPRWWNRESRNKSMASAEKWAHHLCKGVANATTDNYTHVSSLRVLIEERKMEEQISERELREWNRYIASLQ